MTTLVPVKTGNAMTATTRECDVMDGVLVVHKETGWTSHDVVAKLRHLLGATKVGHAGTLDPAATGVLPVLIGKGTRIAEYLVPWDKEYRAVLRLGETTDTQDATGTVLQRQMPGEVTRADVEEAVGRFRGEIQQTPPMYSAVKVHGVPLYRSARAGKTIARDARMVTIHELEVLAIDGSDITLRVVCSKGTYIRTLCADIGATLGVGGHLRTLERTRVGPLTLDRALTVDAVIARHALGRLADDLWSLDEILGTLPALVVDRQTAERVRHGVPVTCSSILSPQAQEVRRIGSTPVRIHDQGGRLLAVGRAAQAQVDRIAIEKVLVNQSG
ncbi:MAG TPA: tRNA pseudouridine(55) synthase TruB [Nitrospira sp.]|nr:tRNA pseudouridine(55) synthase TruB [Nitrospira sp.]